MITTILISKFWGILMVTLGVLFLVKKDLVKKMMEDAKDEKFAFTAGFISLLLGAATWVFSGRGEILLKALAILSFIKGISLIGFPAWRYKMLRPLENNKTLINIILVAIILLGLYLLLNDDSGMRHFRRF